jgi:hypothetical protein
MAGSTPGWLAGGDIRPSRFLMASAAFTAVEADGTTGPIIGVSQEAVHGAPGTAFDDGFAATTAYPEFRTYGVAEQCFVVAGAAFDAGVFLESDANGAAVARSGAAFIGGYSLDAATASNQLVRIIVTPSMTAS